VAFANAWGNRGYPSGLSKRRRSARKGGDAISAGLLQPANWLAEPQTDFSTTLSDPEISDQLKFYMKMKAFLDVTPYSVVEVERSFRGVYSAIKSWGFIHRPDDGDSTLLWNVGLLQRNYTAIYPRRQSIYAVSYILGWYTKCVHSVNSSEKKTLFIENELRYFGVEWIQLAQDIVKRLLVYLKTAY
jgi:hypothetical protein